MRLAGVPRTAGVGNLGDLSQKWFTLGGLSTPLFFDFQI